MEPKTNTAPLPEVKPIKSPSGLDLRPAPKETVRLNRRAVMVFGFVVFSALVGYAYGGYRRQLNNQAEARDAAVPKNIVPATTAGKEFAKEQSNSSAAWTQLADSNHQLQSPGSVMGSQRLEGNCEARPQNSRVFKFDPQTGQPCAQRAGGLQTIVASQQTPLSRIQPAPASAPTLLVTQEPSPEQRRLQLAYQREQEARLAPTVATSGSPGFRSASGSSATNDDEDLSAIATLKTAVEASRTNTATANQAGDSIARVLNTKATENQSDPSAQSAKETFLTSARKSQTDDYLSSTRTQPLSSYEVKAGWEIPAILEQSLNSDLPGEIKALVTSNVYDTATGKHLLIPQGSRLIGKYDSRVAYGQNGVQVVWERIIYPDASSLDLNGMTGLDAQGNAGLRDRVDHHYKRLLGFAALTSAMNAAFAITQRQNQSVLSYPSTAQLAGQAGARDLNELGQEIAHRNLNVQPTIRIPAGYKFFVRVNRDITFRSTYR